MQTKLAKKSRTAITIDPKVLSDAQAKCARIGAKLSSVIEIKLKEWAQEK